jgi:hypothetical protein
LINALALDSLESNLIGLTLLPSGSKTPLIARFRPSEDLRAIDSSASAEFALLLQMPVVSDASARGSLDQTDLPIQWPTNRCVVRLDSNGGQAEVGLDHATVIVVWLCLSLGRP